MGRFRRVLALALLFCLTGCAGLFDTEYTVSELYQAPAVHDTPTDGADHSIADRDGLYQAIMELVAGREESARLQFANYDGDVSQDLSAVCWEVKSATALGAFAVEDITYDLSRIVSYYRADMTITTPAPRHRCPQWSRPAACGRCAPGWTAPSVPERPIWRWR